MRDAATSALLAIYRSSEHVDSMRAFTQRFSQRFAELVYDVDEEVAVKGVGLHLGSDSTWAARRPVKGCSGACCGWPEC